MPGQYIFNRCFSPFIKNLIAEKRNAGFQYDHAEWILHKFDEFCVQEQVEDPLITRGLEEKWGTLREAERKTTLAGRVSVPRQMSLYMQAYRIRCHVLGKISCGSSHVAYVLNPKEIRALFKEIDEYQPALNAEVFHRLALEYKILFRMILCCGLRVSEARILQTDMVDLEKGILRIYPSKGSNDRLVYLPEDLRLLGNEYLKTMAIQYKTTSEWFFPASDPKKVLQVAPIGKRFHQFWEKTSCAQECALQPTVPSLRHTFVVLRMND